MRDGVMRSRKFAGKSEPGSAIVVAEEWEGVLPPPEMLKSYYEIGDGVGDRVMDLAKTGLASRHDLMGKALEASKRVLYALFALLGLVVAGAVLVLIFVPWPQSLTAVFGAPILTLGGIKWYRQRTETNLEEDTQS